MVGILIVYWNSLVSLGIIWRIDESIGLSEFRWKAGYFELNKYSIICGATCTFN